jgi:uncharacterized iron-regulated membrane protein
VRAFLLIVHRWAGLTIALVLVVAGLTGAILPFQGELGRLVAPHVWNVEAPAPGATPLSGLELARLVEAETGGTVSYIPLVAKPDRAQAIFVSPRPGQPPLGYDELFVDPYTGAIRDRVRYGDLRDGPVNLMPFLVLFHYSLAAGEWGRFAFGVAALIWAVECLVGIVLSFPRGGKGGRDLLRRWGRAWTVRGKQSGAAFIHDLHRAAGLWIFPAMLVFAWSAVAFNLDQVHTPVQRALGAQGLYRPVTNPLPAPGVPMTWERAVEVGERLMEEEAARRGFTIRGPEALSLNPYAGVMGYYARTSLDGPTQNGSTAVWFDQVSGRPVAFRPPFGNTRADAVDKTFRMLHTADFFGWPYRILVSLFGLLTVVVAVAGVVLWFRRGGAGLRGPAGRP